MIKPMYFFLSGEHPTLPKSEIISIMEAENIEYEMIGQFSQLLRIKTHVEDLQKISARSGMCKSFGTEILFCTSDIDSIMKYMKNVELSDFILPNETFSVRITRVTDSSRNLKTPDLERILGRYIKQTMKKSKVNLSNPKRRFFGILSDEKFLLGLHLYGKEKNLMERMPKKRPVFHPSTMAPKLARCIVNLSRAKKDNFLLDPFCGVGGILIEAGLMGCRILGCDLSIKMVKGAMKNIKNYNLKYDGVILSDARNNPFAPIENIATDPPYGKNSSSLGIDLKELFRDSLHSAYDSLKANGFMAISSPKGANLKSFGEEEGFELIENHDLYVHRSLTREILVFKR